MRKIAIANRKGGVGDNIRLVCIDLNRGVLSRACQINSVRGQETGLLWI